MERFRISSKINGKMTSKNVEEQSESKKEGGNINEKGNNEERKRKRTEIN